MTHDATQPARRLVSIDALRGFAALAVVAVHAVGVHAAGLRDSSPMLYTLLFPLTVGYAGVNLFLVLSGFCIHLRLASRTPAHESLRLPFCQFWLRRFWRLYPAYLAALVFSAAALVAITLWQGNTSDAGAMAAHWRSILVAFLAHAAMLQLFIPSVLGGLGNGVFWSLALEEVLYVLYTPLLWMRNRVGLGGAIAIVGTLCVAWRAVGVALLGAIPPLPVGVTQSNPVWMYQAPARWFEWCLGAIAVEAYLGRARLPSWCYQPALGILSLIAAVAASYHPVGWVITDLAWGVGFFVMLNWAVHREVRATTPLTIPWHALASVGVISYSLYLVHVPILRFAKLLAFNLGYREAGAVVAEIIAMALSLPAAWFFFVLFERPFLRALQRPTRDERSIAGRIDDTAIAPARRAA